MKVFLGGAWREIGSGKVYVGGAWRTLTRGLVYKSGAWRSAASFIAPLNLSISPPFVVAVGFGSAPQTLTTEPVTATPGGGLGPFTYAWTIVSNTGSPVSILNPSLATTSFSQSQPPGDTDNTALAECTVTDSQGSTATATVDLSFQKTF